MKRKEPPSPPVTRGEAQRLQAFQSQISQQRTDVSNSNDSDGQMLNTGYAPHKRRRLPQASANDEEFGFRVRNETQRAPRFLFTCWAEDHECDQTTLSANPIVPTMFQAGQRQRDVLSIPKQEIIEAGVAQLSTSHTGLCYFSPWMLSWKEYSQSVKRLLQAVHTPCICIAILDTKKLPNSCAVLHESFFTAQDSSSKFLVYGIVPPEAFGATTAAGILESRALDGISIGHDWPHWTYFQEAIENACKFSECFGQDFVLPVAAALLSAPDDKLRSAWLTGKCPSLARVLKVLQRYSLPSDWASDPSILSKNAHSETHQDVERFYRVLRELTVMKDPHLAKSPDISMNDAFDITWDGVLASRLHPFRAMTFSGKPDTVSYRPLTLNHEPDNDSDMDSWALASESSEILPPPGKMDVKTKEKIVHAQNKVPRYLFRAWCNHPGCPSGGRVALNSTRAITPLAFHDRSADLDKSIFDLSQTELQVMTWLHLNGRDVVATEFSSWASSLNVAFEFAEEHLDGNCHISINDTRVIPSRNVAVHVPDFADICSASKNYAYPWE
jgi:hypothetical protein